MIVIGLVLAAGAALLHVFIFYLESCAWTGPQARGVFGMDEEKAVATREMAFNQGFYNLFLAVLVALGIVLYATGADVPGVTLVLAGCGSMAAAALVLLLSSPDKASAAVKQGVLPALGVIAVALGLLW